MIKKQDISSTIRGRTNINSQIADVMSLAKENIIICATSSELKKRTKLLEPILKRISDNGIKITLAISGEDSEIKQISDRFNIKAKKIDVNASFYIADKKEILFMLTETAENQDQLAVWFSSEFFVNSLTSLFDLAIKKSPNIK